MNWWGGSGKSSGDNLNKLDSPMPRGLDQASEESKQRPFQQKF